MYREKLIIVEGVDRIGKSSFLIPLIQSEFAELYDAELRVISDYDIKRYDKLTKNIKLEGLMTSDDNRLYQNIATMYSAFNYMSLTQGPLLLDRSVLSMIVYDMLFGRFDDYSGSIDKEQYLKSINDFEMILNACFDVRHVTVTWDDEDNVLLDEKLTIYQSKQLNELMQEYEPSLVFKKKIHLRLHADANGHGKYSYNDIKAIKKLIS